jgi:hypothetical protein
VPPATRPVRPGNIVQCFENRKVTDSCTIWSSMKIPPRRLRAISPVSRPSFVMRDGHNAHCDRFIPIDDGERESVQDESAHSVLIGRPTSRPLGKIFECNVNLGEESGTGFIISSSIAKPRLFPPLAMPADGNGTAYLLASDSRAARRRISSKR